VDRDLNHLLEAFVEDMELRGLSPETIRSHRSNLRTVLRFWESQGVDPLAAGKEELRLLLTYLREERGVGAKTLGSYYSALSSFYEYLVYEGLAPGNPVPGFRKRYLKTYKNHQPSPSRKLISVEEMAAKEHFSVPNSCEAVSAAFSVSRSVNIKSSINPSYSPPRGLNLSE